MEQAAFTHPIPRGPAAPSLRTSRFLAFLTLLLPTMAAAQSTRVIQDSEVLTYPNLEADITSDTTPLLFSNSPEYPDRSGVLYRDTLAGNARVLAYHVNALGRPARLLVLARNVGDEPSTLQITRRGTASTSRPDPLVGQASLLRYFAALPLAARTLQPGETSLLYTSAPLRPGAVENIMLDLQASAPTELSVVIIPDDELGPPAAFHDLPVLPRDARHQRGTFEGANRSVSVTLPVQAARLTLGAQTDPALQGTDVLTGDPQTLRGNFGVLYTVEVQGAQDRRLALSARGGVYRGTLQVLDDSRVAWRLIGEGGALKDKATLPVLWRGRDEQFTVQFVPASGSNLPVALVFYPPQYAK